MSAPRVWIIGQGGLLGRHLAASLGARFPDAKLWKSPLTKRSWNDPDKIAEELRADTRAFFAEARGSRWMILWAAGQGFVGATAEALERESRTWNAFLEAVSAENPGRGSIFLASSAGGVYGNQEALPITEESPALPISDYGRNKLKQEEALQEWRAKNPGISTLVGRISNLYGPGQNLSKRQGIISQFSKCILTREPLNVFVALDTIRDYHYVVDCAADVLMAMEKLAAEPEGTQVTKIFAAEQGASVSQIIGAFSQLTQNRARFLTTIKPESRLQPRTLSYRSKVWPEIGARSGRTTLLEGIQATHFDQLQRYLAGELSRAA